MITADLILNGKSSNSGLSGNTSNNRLNFVSHGYLEFNDVPEGCTSFPIKTKQFGFPPNYVPPTVMQPSTSPSKSSDSNQERQPNDDTIQDEPKITRREKRHLNDDDSDQHGNSAKRRFTRQSPDTSKVNDYDFQDGNEDDDFGRHGTALTRVYVDDSSDEERQNERLKRISTHNSDKIRKPNKYVTNWQSTGSINGSPKLNKQVKSAGQNSDSGRFTMQSRLERYARPRFNGLVNQGATCYMNSAIQMMFFTNCLRLLVYHIQKPDERIITSLQRLFYELQFGNNEVETRQLAEALRVGFYEQQDIQEFCRLFFDKIESIVKDTTMKNMLSCFFKGGMRNYIKCVEVDYESSREEDFYDLSLTVKGMKNIYQSFADYVKPERLCGDNKYDAGEFGRQEAKKGLWFIKFPRVLHIHLKRFDYDGRLDRRYKINDRFEFYQHIDLNRYIDPKHGEKDDYKYVLHSVLVHSGRSGSGHYKVFINTGLENGQTDVWHCFNDSFVSSCTPKEAIENNFGEDEDSYRYYQSSQNAYMLVYIQENRLKAVLQPITKDKIPLSLHRQFESQSTSKFSWQK